MSEGVAFGAGLAIGLVMVVTVLVVKRDEVARSLRLHRNGAPDAGAGLSASAGQSRGAKIFGYFSAVITIGAGVLLGEPLLLLAGAVLLIGHGVQAVLTRRPGHR